VRRSGFIISLMQPDPLNDFDYVNKDWVLEIWVRIPAEADQHSWMKPITIPV
jgi:hypothetical protein